MPERTIADPTDQSRPTQAKILLVDDEPANLLALEVVLSDLGEKLVKASSGAEALRWLLKEDFALILLDVRMPDMDGLETAALIRQRRRCQQTPIIFLTGHGADDAAMFRGYSLGAVDFLLKPFQPKVLRSKVAVFVDIYHKTERIKRQSELLRRLQQQEHERQLAEAQERWQAERLHDQIRIAREIQQHLFPAAPLPLPGFDISGGSYPAEATGGDYFDYIPMPDGSLAAVIGDISGHGFGPALLMAELRAYLRAFMLTRTDLRETIGLVNRALVVDTPEDRFATLVVAQLDSRTRSLIYASAGHQPSYILEKNGLVKMTLNNNAVPLAVTADATFETTPPISLEPGDMVVMFTDGVLEAHDSDQELFGVERTLELVRSNRDRSAREIVDRLYSSARAFCGSRTQVDDMTAIVIKVAP
jgi:serine phosphatase RsbU (regulator of sigma subunit)